MAKREKKPPSDPLLSNSKLVRTAAEARHRKAKCYERQAAVGISLLGPPPSEVDRPVKMLKISEDIIRACAVVLDLGFVHAHHAAAIALLKWTNNILEECGHEAIDIEKLTSAKHFKIGVRRGRGVSKERWHEIARRNKIGPYSDKAIAKKAQRDLADAADALSSVSVHGHEESSGGGPNSPSGCGCSATEEQVGDLPASGKA